MPSWRDGNQPKQRPSRPASSPDAPRKASAGRRESWKGAGGSRRPRRVFLGGDEGPRLWRRIRLGGPALLLIAAALVALFIYIAALLPDPLALHVLYSEDWSPESPGVQRDAKSFDDFRAKNLAKAIRVDPVVDKDPLEFSAGLSARKQSRAAYYVIGRGFATGERAPGEKHVMLRPRLAMTDQPEAGPREVELEDWLQSLPQGAIVILDASRGRDRWDLGESYNLFPAAVAEAVERIAGEQNGASRELSVITSCGEGERDWRTWLRRPGALIVATRESLAGDGENQRSWRQVKLWPTVTVDNFTRYVQDRTSGVAASDLSWRQNPFARVLGDGTRQIARAVNADVATPNANLKVDELKDRYQKIEELAQELAKNIAGEDLKRFRGAAPLHWARIGQCIYEAEAAALEPGEPETGTRNVARAVENALRAAQALHDLARVPTPSRAWAQLIKAAEDPANHRTDVFAVALREQLEALAGRPDASVSEKAFAALVHDNVDWKRVANLDAAQAVRLAVVVRDMSERAATCSDPRAHWLTSERLEPLEEQRRIADDDLLANNWKEAHYIYVELESKFKRELAFQEAVKEALSRIDETLAEAPWRAQWSYDDLQLAAFGLTDSENPNGREKVDEAYRSAIEAAAQLAHLDADSPPPVWRGETLSTIIEDKFRGESLPGLFKDIRSLQNPWWWVSAGLAGDSSSNLHVRHQFVAEHCETLLNGSASSTSSEGELHRYRTDVASDINKGVHPIQAMLDLKSISTQADGDTTQGEKLSAERQAILELAAQSQKVLNDRLERLDVLSDAGTSNADRSKLFQESIANRRAAWMIVQREPFRQALQARDSQRLLDPFYIRSLQEQRRWLAERAIRDFWGDGKTPADRPDAYVFAQLARFFLGADEQSSGTEETGPDAALAELLAEAQAVAASIQNLDRPAVTYDETGESSLIGVTSRNATDDGSGTASQFIPDETVAAWQLVDENRLIEFKPHGQENAPLVRRISARKQDGEYSLNADLPSGSAPKQASLQFRFRGHLASHPLKLAPEQLKWLEIAHQPYARAPSVKVINNNAPNLNIAFILDCSGSMSEGKDTDLGSRMSRAKSALTNLITSLHRYAGSRCSVSLWAYGHRSRWKKVDGEYVDLVGDQKGWDCRGAARVCPDIDVEELEALDAISKNQVKIQQALQRLNYYGQTPLCYAIHNVLESLPDPSPGTEQHVVVLTDGHNNVLYEGNEAPLVSQKYDELVEIESELKNNPTVRLTVIALDFEGDELKKLTGGPDNFQRTQGRYISVNGDKSWRQGFDDWVNWVLGPAGFDVRKVGEAVPEDLSLNPFGTSSRVSVQNFAPHEYKLRVLTFNGQEVCPAKAYLEGWENLQLEYVDGNEKFLRFLSYDPNEGRRLDGLPKNPDWLNQTWEGPQSARLLSTTFPGFRDPYQKVHFKVAFQLSDDKRQTRSPEIMWAEFTPMEGRRELPQSKLRSCDVYCERRSVPVVSWVLPDWPEKANRARIEYHALVNPDLVSKQWEVWDVPAGRDSQSEKICGVIWKATWSSTDHKPVLTLSASGAGSLDVIVRLRHGPTLTRSTRLQSNSPSGRVEHRFELSSQAQGQVTMEFLPASVFKQVVEKAPPDVASWGKEEVDVASLGPR